MNDKRRYIWFAVFVLVVFVVGAAGGVLADRLLRPRAPADPQGRRAAAGRGPAEPGRVRHQLSVDLNLTADQQKQLDAIFATRREHVQQLQSEMQARFETEQRDFRAEIAKILTPDQQKRFEEWLSREQVPGLRLQHRPGMGPGRGMGRGRGPGF